MKYWKYLLILLGFTFQYILPIVVFGCVVPYTHGTIKSGLTGAGIVAIAVIVLIISNKIKTQLEKQPKSIVRGIILSSFPIAIWCVLGIGLDKVSKFFMTLVEYWWLALIFIVLGRIFFIIEESVSDGQ